MLECLACCWGSGFAKRDLKVSIVGAANRFQKIGLEDDDEAGWLSARARGPMLNDDAKLVACLIRKPAPSRRAKHKDGAGGAEAVAGYARVGEDCLWQRKCPRLS